MSIPELMIKISNGIKYIDITTIIEESNSEILNKLPGFAVKWIAKIIRQDEMNRILGKYSDCTGLNFLINIIEEFNLKLEIEGEENLPENGKCFFVSNHPFGVIDGLVLTFIVLNRYGSLKAIANDAFMFVPQLRPLIAAVNVFGRSSKEYIKALKGEAICPSITPSIPIAFRLSIQFNFSLVIFESSFLYSI